MVSSGTNRLPYSQHARLTKILGLFGIRGDQKQNTMAKVNIHIAEDDKDDFLMLKEAIEEVLPKFNIDHSKNGRELLESITTGLEPDLIFLDLNMPIKNGIECLTEIRRILQLQLVPVIIYSTSSHFEDIDACYKNGCTLYMVKPTSFRDLVRQIKKVFFRIGLPKVQLADKETFVVQKHEE
jgi:CheY-like chemotaxis protein